MLSHSALSISKVKYSNCYCFFWGLTSVVVEFCPFCLPDVPHVFSQHAKSIKMSMITLKQLLKMHLIFEKTSIIHYVYHSVWLNLVKLEHYHLIETDIIKKLISYSLWEGFLSPVITAWSSALNWTWAP